MGVGVVLALLLGLGASGGEALTAGLFLAAAGTDEASVLAGLEGTLGAVNVDDTEGEVLLLSVPVEVLTTVPLAEVDVVAIAAWLAEEVDVMPICEEVDGILFALLVEEVITAVSSATCAEVVEVEDSETFVLGAAAEMPESVPRGIWLDAVAEL